MVLHTEDCSEFHRSTRRDTLQTHIETSKSFCFHEIKQGEMARTVVDGKICYAMLVKTSYCKQLFAMLECYAS